MHTVVLRETEIDLLSNMNTPHKNIGISHYAEHAENDVKNSATYDAENGRNNYAQQKEQRKYDKHDAEHVTVPAFVVSVFLSIAFTCQNKTLCAKS